MTSAPINIENETEQNNDKLNEIVEPSPKEIKTKKKSKIKKDKNDPFRFQDKGVVFKGKLIGVQEVQEAKSDKICQEALQTLKNNVRSSGKHKQKINIFISLSGFKIVDEKTGEVLHQHPVSKISFIARDMTDARAFGYIFGSPKEGHSFCGIKTEKDSGHVVLTMKDLFQVVYEIKKKELENSKELISNEEIYKVPVHNAKPVVSDYDVPSNEPVLIFLDSASTLSKFQDELDNIQQNIDQMEDQLSDEMFFSLLESSTEKISTPNSSANGALCSTTNQDDFFNGTSQMQNLFIGNPFKSDNFSSFEDVPSDTDKYAAFYDLPETSVFPSSEINLETEVVSTVENSTTTNTITETSSNLQPKDPFADLFDFGKSKPIQDKNSFFAEIKKPPRKTLNELKKSNDSLNFHSDESETPFPPPRSDSFMNNQKDFSNTSLNPTSEEKAWEPMYATINKQESTA